MKVVRLGADGPPVTVMGLGLAALGRPGYMTLGHAEDIGEDASIEAMEANSHAMLDLAWASGIRYFDVARSYGRGEAFVASWLRARRIAPGEVTIGSKWGYTYIADWRRTADKHEVKEHSVENFQRQWALTRALLGAHLSLYMIHSATLESGVLDRPAVLAAMQAAREETGVRLGLSVTGPNQSAVLRRAIATGMFDAVQATWNLLDPSIGEALLEAHEAGMGVIIKESVANGRLTSRAPEMVARARAAGRDEPLDALAISAALSQPFADVVLSGAVTPDQLRSNLTALSIAPPDWGDWSEAPEAYWGHRKHLQWT